MEETNLIFQDYILFLGIDIFLYLGLGINQRRWVKDEFFYRQRYFVIKEDAKDFVLDLLLKAKYHK